MKFWFLFVLDFVVAGLQTGAVAKSVAKKTERESAERLLQIFDQIFFVFEAD